MVRSNFVDMLETRLIQMDNELIPESNQNQHRSERIPCGQPAIVAEDVLIASPACPACVLPRMNWTQRLSPLPVTGANASAGRPSTGGAP